MVYIYIYTIGIAQLLPLPPVPSIPASTVKVTVNFREEKYAVM